jgi:amidase
VFPLEWHEPEAVGLQALRISFHTDNGIATPTPETQTTVTEVALRLESMVIAVDDVKPAGVEQTMDLSGLYSWDGGAAVKRLLGEAGTTESPRLTQENPALDATELDALLARWYSFRSSMHSFMADYDVIVCPANAGPAPVHGPEMEEFSRFTYTFTYNLTGWPAAVVRAGTSPEGLPIGVQIVARPGREDVALAVAKFVETEFGGFQRSAL